MNDTYLDARKVAKMFDLSVRHVRERWPKQSGMPKPKRIGGRLRWALSELQAYIKKA